MSQKRTRYAVLTELIRGPFSQLVPVHDRAMNIDQPANRASGDQNARLEWHRSLESVLSERQAIDAFRVWLRMHRRDEALDLYLAIIAFRKNALKKDQRAMNMAYAMQKKYICPRTGLCDFLPPKLRQDISHKVVQYRARKQIPPVDIFDLLAPYVWSYLCEQHSLFVCSKEFGAVVKAAEAGQSRAARDLSAQRAAANARIPPLIGFAKYRCRDSADGSARRRGRAKSEPPVKAAKAATRASADADEEPEKAAMAESADDELEVYPIRHDKPEDRQLFVQILADRLAPLAIQQLEEDQHVQEALRLDLGAESASSWDDDNAIPPEALCEWSLEPSARVATTRGLAAAGRHRAAMHKSASIAFSENNDGLGSAVAGQTPNAPRLRKFDSLNASAFRRHIRPTPFLSDHLFAVHTHLVAPLSNKYGQCAHDSYAPMGQTPPPPAPHHQLQAAGGYGDAARVPLNGFNVYQQFSDSSGFCSSESAHFQLADLNETSLRHGAMPRDNSFPFDNQYRAPCDWLQVSYRDQQGVPFVTRIQARSMSFREFRLHFGISSRTTKRFLFKEAAEDGRAPYQWTVIMEDSTLLPIFEGRITAECRDLADPD